MNTREDIYPTFSICFKGAKLRWFNDLAIFDIYGISADEYENMLTGGSAFRYEYNLTSRLYRKTQVLMGNRWNRMFDTFPLQIFDILRDLEFVTEDPKYTITFGPKDVKSGQQPPFHIGYQSSNVICFTRDSGEETLSLRKYDRLFLKRSVLSNKMYQNAEIHIVFHYPGHLMRTLSTPSLSTSFLQYRTRHVLDLKVYQTTLLRKRQDSNFPCNDRIHFYDRYLQEQISKRFGCVPPYWKNILNESVGHKLCSKPSTLVDVNSYIQNNIQRTFNISYDVPCVKMINVVTSNWRRKLKTHLVNNKDVSLIKLEYRERHYQEIKYAEDFGFESFWSGLGGYVGIFLGYSLLQIPELLGKYKILHLLYDLDPKLLHWNYISTRFLSLYVYFCFSNCILLYH